MVANWLHIDSKLLISFFQYLTGTANSPEIPSGYIKTEENFAEADMVTVFCTHRSLMAS